MKKMHLIFILIFAPLFGFSQGTIVNDFKYKATYELTYQPDSTDINSNKSELMVLYLGDKISRFSSLGTIVGDSLMEHRDKSNKNMAAFARLRAQIPETNFDYYIYKGIPENKLSYTQEIVKDNYRVIEDLAMFEWEIQPETKTIRGFKSQKATTKFAGRDYTAWFTSEIPIPDGPYKFNGLPGLIMEISDKNNHYSFLISEFQKSKQPIPFIFNPEKYLLTKKDELKSINDDYNRNPFAALERQGITIGFQSGQKEKMEKEHREEIKKKNNPIELE